MARAKAESDQQNDGYIKALLEERRGYEVNGDEGGITAVNAELDRLGYQAEKPSKRAESR